MEGEQASQPAVNTAAVFELSSIKANMDRRKKERAVATYHLLGGKTLNAMIICRQMLANSNNIYKDFEDERKD